MFDTEPKAPDLQMLRMRDVTEMLKVSEMTIRRRMRKQQFPQPVRMGSSILFRRADIAAFVEHLGGDR